MEMALNAIRKEQVLESLTPILKGSRGESVLEVVRLCEMDWGLVRGCGVENTCLACSRIELTNILARSFRGKLGYSYEYHVHLWLQTLLGRIPGYLSRYDTVSNSCRQQDLKSLGIGDWLALLIVSFAFISSSYRVGR